MVYAFTNPPSGAVRAQQIIIEALHEVLEFRVEVSNCPTVDKQGLAPTLASVSGPICLSSTWAWAGPLFVSPLCLLSRTTEHHWTSVHPSAWIL